METTLTIAPKGVSAITYVPEQVQRVDTQVPKVKAVDSAATLPADKIFVAQVVNARLSGTAFPENPSEIAPPERVLKPYNMPMLPAEKEEPPAETAKAEEPVTIKAKEVEEPAFAVAGDDAQPREVKATTPEAEPQTKQKRDEPVDRAEPQISGELADERQTAVG